MKKRRKRPKVKCAACGAWKNETTMKIYDVPNDVYLCSGKCQAANRKKIDGK